MPYCIYCGVKVNDRHRDCPLCNRGLEYTENRKSLTPLYPDEVSKIAFIKSQTNKKEIIAIHFIGFLTLLIILLNLGIDYTLNKTLTWSRISGVSLLFAFGVRTLLLFLRRNPYIFYTLTNIFLGLYLYILDKITLGASWFVLYAMPSLLSLQFGSCIIFMLFKKVKSRLLRASISIIISNIYLIIVNEITSKSIKWGLICTAVLLPTALFLFLLHSIRKSLN